MGTSKETSLVWEVLASTKRPEKLTGELRAAAQSGGAVRRDRLGKSSFPSILLGSFLFGQQFAKASAESTCYAFGFVKKRFDLIGLIPVFGTRAATKSLSYSALNDGRFYATGHIGPGSLTVAGGLLEATGNHLASLFTAGRPGDAYDLVQLDCPGGLRYVGLNSNTECPVSNAVGASIVREYHSLWEDCSMALTELEYLKPKQAGRCGSGKDIEVEGGHRLGRRVGRDARREVKVVVLKIGITTEKVAWRAKDIRVSLKSNKGVNVLLGWLPLGLTIGVIHSCFICKQWFVAGLIMLGTLAMMFGVLGLRLCIFKFCKPKVARASPAGDCLVVDDTDADILHVVMGDEECIQALFQRKIEYEASLGKYVMFLAGCMFYIYIIASVLYMPNVSTTGQILFATANLIGLVTDMLKATRNGKLGLAKKACEQLKIVAKDSVVFLNRTAAVAFVAKHAKDRTMLKSKKLLPCDGAVWQTWWEVLAKYDGKSGDNSIKSVVVDADEKDQGLLKILLEDMRDGLEA